MRVARSTTDHDLTEKLSRPALYQTTVQPAAEQQCHQWHTLDVDHALTLVIAAVHVSPGHQTRVARSTTDRDLTEKLIWPASY